MVDQNTVHSVVLLLAFVATAAVNGTVTTGNGVTYTNSEIADSHPTYLMPTGSTFGIWGIIYLFVAAFCVYQAIPTVRSQPEIVSVRPLMLAALAFNVTWLYLFAFAIYWVAFVVIAAYAAVLLRAVLILDIRWMSTRTPLVTKLLVAAPFSLNASWVVVATCLQVGVNATEEGWLASEDFCAGLLFVAVVLACYRCVARADVAYGFVGAWALWGIIKNQGDDSTFGCASRICNPACVDSMALCSAEGRFRTLCANYASSGVDACNGWGDSVPKGGKMVAACWVYMALVLTALVCGIARGCAHRNFDASNPAHQARKKLSSDSHNNGLVLHAHGIATGATSEV